jgi:predicted small lipoprotein YifL
MRIPLATLLIGLLLAAAPACGRKGPLELPPGGAPMPVEALAAVPGDGTVLLQWTNPAKSVSGRPLGPLEAVEIWIFDRGLTPGGQSLTADAVEKTARLVRRIQRQELGTFERTPGDASGGMAFTYALGPQAAPAKLAFMVRVIDRRGRASEFSAPVAVDLVRKEASIDRPAVEGVS